MSRPSGSRLSASGRVLLAMTLMLAATIAALVIIGYLITVQALDAELERALEREAQAYGAAVQGAPASQGLAEATRGYLGARTQTGAGRDVVLLVRLPGGRTISNSDISIEKAPGNAAMATTPTAPAFSEFSYRGRGFRVLSAPVRTPEGVVGVFQAAIDVSSVRPTARRVALTLAAAGLLALALVLPFAYLATRRALRPLRQMASDAERITHERPGGRLAYEGPKDELGSLAETLNSMLERLEGAFDDQRRFVADASHELRTPVAVIRGNVELLRTGVLHDEERPEALAAIEDETARMGRLLDDLLALARFETGDGRTEQALEVRALLEEAAARTRALGRTATLSADCEAWVLGDPDLLDQVFANLSRNAIAHTDADGAIEFALPARARARAHHRHR